MTTTNTTPNRPTREPGYVEGTPFFGVVQCCIEAREASDGVLSEQDAIDEAIAYLHHGCGNQDVPEYVERGKRMGRRAWLMLSR